MFKRPRMPAPPPPPPPPPPAPAPSAKAVQRPKSQVQAHQQAARMGSSLYRIPQINY